MSPPQSEGGGERGGGGGGWDRALLEKDRAAHSLIVVKCRSGSDASHGGGLDRVGFRDAVIDIPVRGTTM